MDVRDEARTKKMVWTAFFALLVFAAALDIVQDSHHEVEEDLEDSIRDFLFTKREKHTYEITDSETRVTLTWKERASEPSESELIEYFENYYANPRFDGSNIRIPEHRNRFGALCADNNPYAHLVSGCPEYQLKERLAKRLIAADFYIERLTLPEQTAWSCFESWDWEECDVAIEFMIDAYELRQ